LGCSIAFGNAVVSFFNQLLWIRVSPCDQGSNHSLDHWKERGAQTLWVDRAFASGDIVHFSIGNDYVVPCCDVRLQSLCQSQRLRATAGAAGKDLPVLDSLHSGKHPPKNDLRRIEGIIHCDKVARTDGDSIVYDRLGVVRVYADIAVQRLHLAPCASA
jgi:hypothetical protein